MSYLYNSIAPTVIDEDMLAKAVEEQGPQNVAGMIAKDEGIEWKSVTALRLDYQNILRIEGLWEFVSLTKLQLDNNIIEKIEGIDMLVNLVWLDLSFNNIEVIEGLDKLTKIEDLSLFNNNIKVLEHIDTLLNLEVLSIGNNQLDQLDNLIYLRQFPKLRSLNLSNNPLCDDPNYSLFIGAFLPDLVYLDYRLMDDDIRKEGYENYYISVESLMSDERAAAREREKAERRAVLVARYKSAFVHDVEGTKLYDKMFGEDPEGTTLLELPGADDIAMKLKISFTDICQKLFDFGLQASDKRDAEVALFWECLQEAKEENKREGSRLIDNFLEEKKLILNKLREMTEAGDIQTAVCEYNSKVTRLWDQLMGLEMVLFEQVEDTVQQFDLSLQDLLCSFTEQVQELMAKLREVQGIFYDKTQTLANDLMDPILRGDFEVSPKLAEIFVDKDTMQSAVATSHDTHQLRIDTTEDAMLSGYSNWMNKLLKKIRQEEEIERSRNRVVEINHLIDYFREELDCLEMTEID